MPKLARVRSVFFIALASLAVATCEVSKSANPLSPNIGGPIAGVEISPPNLLEPGQDWEIRTRDQPVKLMFQNANSSGQRPLFYTLEVATDAAFTSIVLKRTSIQPGNVTTTVQLTDMLPTGRAYWWRVRAEDGANVGEYSKPVRFTAVSPVDLGTPVAVSPSGSITTITPAFRVRAGSKNGPYERIVYTLQVSNSQTFSSIAATFVVDEAGAETIITQNYSFLNDRTYYWRVQARDNGESRAVSAWSAVLTFEPNIPAPPPPPPDGGGGGGGGNDEFGKNIDPAKCGPPSQTTAIGILRCHRSRYPEHMSPSQAVAFLKASARDMNRAGVSGGPYGVLRKKSGNNCLGYSCDIICAGQGSSQRQRDVLIDEKYATWGSPLGAGQRVDVCEIQ